MKVTHAFLSLTEVDQGHHQSYNQWHLFDHMPEQFPLNGVVFGQRWVLTPQLRPHMHAVEPLDRVHYFTLYLMTEPIEDTLRDFRDLAVQLRGKGRFHEHRTAHIFGPMAVRNCEASPAALVGPEALPYRPNRGVYVCVSDAPDAAPVDVSGVPGVAGAWTFTGTPLSPPELRDATLTVCWLDDDPRVVAPLVEAVAPGARFAATLASVDAWSDWRWFDS